MTPIQRIRPSQELVRICYRIQQINMSLTKLIRQVPTCLKTATSLSCYYWYKRFQYPPPHLGLADPANGHSYGFTIWSADYHSLGFRTFPTEAMLHRCEP